MALTFVYGVIGGALAELLKWYALRESPNLPLYLRSGFYWVVTVLMALAGGGLALIQGVAPDNPWLAINIGLTAPLILKGFASVVPIQPAKGGGAADPAVPFGGPTAPPPSLIDFVAGR